MKYTCEFKIITRFGCVKFYACIVKNQHITEDEEYCFIGDHKKTRSEADVKLIWFENCKMSKVPQKLTKVFPNLVAICIEKTNLRCISKNDLADYKNLVLFSCNGSKIEFVPGDLFQNFQNLEGILFCGNELKFIEPNILEGLDKLQHVHLEFKAKYQIDYCNSLKGYDSVEDVGIEIFSQYFSRLKSIYKPDYSQESSPEDLESKEDPFMSDVYKYLNDETFMDFKIIIDDREFPVHKFLLAARSPTLAEMQRNNPEAENLKLVDISVEIFELILKFLYTDKLPNEEGTNYMHLFAAAGRFGVKDLKDHAAVQLLDVVDEQNALEILSMSVKYGHVELKQKSFEEIKKNYPKIEFRDEWIENNEKLAELVKALKMKDQVARTIDKDFQKLVISNE